MERKLFTWKSWNPHDLLELEFVDCTAVVDFGPYKVGDNIPAVFVDFGKGVIETYSDGQVVWKGKLSLVVTDG